MSHTPGPWEYDADRVAIISRAYVQGATTDPVTMGGEDEIMPISVVSLWSAMGGSDTESDRLLMTAGPEMLAALQVARDVVAIISQPDGALLRQIDAAIRKATLRP